MFFQVSSGLPSSPGGYSVKRPNVNALLLGKLSWKTFMITSVHNSTKHIAKVKSFASYCCNTQEVEVFVGTLKLMKTDLVFNIRYQA